MQLNVIVYETIFRIKSCSQAHKRNDRSIRVVVAKWLGIYRLLYTKFERTYFEQIF